MRTAWGEALLSDCPLQMLLRGLWKLWEPPSVSRGVPCAALLTRRPPASRLPFPGDPPLSPRAPAAWRWRARPCPAQPLSLEPGPQQCPALRAVTGKDALGVGPGGRRALRPHVHLQRGGDVSLQRKLSGTPSQPRGRGPAAAQVGTLQGDGLRIGGLMRAVIGGQGKEGQWGCHEGLLERGVAGGAQSPRWGRGAHFNSIP